MYYNNHSGQKQMATPLTYIAKIVKNINFTNKKTFSGTTKFASTGH